MTIPSFSEFISEALDLKKYHSSGDPHTRGEMDSHYGRKRDPHYYPAEPTNEYGGRERVTSNEMTKDEIEAYHAGYDKNEESGDKKDFGTSYDRKTGRTRTVYAR